MPDPSEWHLIDRYLAGEASPAETATVRARIDADPAWADAVEMLRADFSARRDSRWHTEQAWSTTQQRTLAHHDELAARRAASSAIINRPWGRIAAGLLIAAGSLATWQYIGRSHSTVANATFSDIRTPNGTRQTVTLGDGSRVTLNAGSRLHWAPDFNTRTRDVHLEGEAFFVVSHDASRPFRVHARGAVAHDLGTRFTVRAYAELAHVQVVVAEGAVSLRHDRASADSAVLTVGQLGRLGETGAPTVESNVPVERWTAWTGGALVLEGLTLTEVLPQLERWYDVSITVTDKSLAARRVSARFHDETLPQMLDALTLALHAQWQQSGRSVVLNPVDR